MPYQSKAVISGYHMFLGG